MKFSKIFISIVVLCLFAKWAAAKNYYFSSVSGNDSYTVSQAQTPLKPWKTLSKLNSFFPQIAAGDSILFKRGEVFYGTIIVSKSGASSLPIVFSAYGVGANPVISGFFKITSWTNKGGGIWQGDCPSCTPNLNMITLNGAEQAVGRYPNTGYLTYDSHSGNNSITDKQLPGSPNWTGAELVIRKKDWAMESGIITSHAGNTIKYSITSTWAPTDGYGYFIQKDPKTLDVLGEWYHGPLNKKIQMFFGGTPPSSYVVNASTSDTLVNINKHNYINFSNLTFQGSNVAAFQITNANNIHINSCNVIFSGLDAINTSGGNNCNDIRLENSTVNHTNNNAFRGGWAFNNIIIRNNSILNTGTIPGMGKSSDNDSYDGVATEGNNLTFENNRVDSVGHIGVRFEGNNDLIRNNFISNYTLTKYDGSGIYTYTDPADKTKHHGQKVIRNIVIGRGVPTTDQGTGKSNGGESDGIYMDVYPANIQIDSNTVANCMSDGMMINGAINMNVKNNTLYNNNCQVDHNTQWDSKTNYDYTRNLNVKNNILFSAKASQLVMAFFNNSRDTKVNTDSNYYCRVADTTKILYKSIASATQSSGKYYTLANWKLTFKQDKNSTGRIFKNNDLIRFEYNGTNQKKTVSLDQIYLDVKNNSYTKAVVLNPYTSIILIGTGKKSGKAPVNPPKKGGTPIVY